MEIAVVGGGIVGCAAAAFLAEASAQVTLYERYRVAAGASGRNQGLLQNPMDEILTPLYVESLRLHAETAPALRLDRPPEGLLLVSHSPDGPRAIADRVAATNPELEPVFLEHAHATEPALSRGVTACRLETGHQIPPATATEAWATRARAAGVSFVVGDKGTVPARGLSRLPPADAVLFATGAWAPAAVQAVWGVTVSVRMATPPRHALEEAVIDAIATMTGAVPPAFAAVTADGVTTIGATFQADEPDHAADAPALINRASAFLREVSAAPVVGSRACARPVSPDGRPLIGRLPGEEHVWVATGNGPWGMSCGPATARITGDAMLGRASVPPALSLDRLRVPDGA